MRPSKVWTVRISNRSVPVPVTEVVNMVHKLTDTVMEMNRQTRDDAVTRERLLLQQQQIMQRDFAERENKLVEWQRERDKLQKEKELLLAEKQKEKELALAQKQHEALLVQQQSNMQALLIEQQRERDRMQEERYLQQREKELIIIQKQNDAQTYLVQTQLEREKRTAELNDRRSAEERARIEADNCEKLELTKQLAAERQIRAVRELELKAELDLERQLREWEREKLAGQPQAIVTVTSSPQSNAAMQASELSTAATTANANQSVQSMNVDVDVLTSAYQPIQADVVAAPAVVTQSVVEAEALPCTASIAGTAITQSLCSMPSVSTYTNALFTELLSLLPSVSTQSASNVVSAAKTELPPTARAEVMQGPQVPQAPQLPATTALASSISWPGQATKPIVSNTQPGPLRSSLPHQLTQ